MMLGIMRYSTAIIQYDPSAETSKKRGTELKVKDSDTHGTVGQKDATSYLKGGFIRARNKMQVDT